MPAPTDTRFIMWTYTGEERPPFAKPPGPGQESVWDYPRPPRLEPDSRRVVVRLGDLVIADTREAIRVLETASPPTFYLPQKHLDLDRLFLGNGSSFCEWKGAAQYWSVRTADDRLLVNAGWSYLKPPSRFEAIRDWVSFYPAKLECYVDGERVRPQPGGFYGGWVTSEIVGPIKGEPGTGGW